MNWETVRTLEEQGYVAIQQHPTAELWIINYTERCQYENYWTEETMQCRGLIVDKDFNIVARPFKKFFNLEQHLNLANSLPLKWNEPFSILEKMDGSLGILYWVDDEPFIATRGSFSSEQALKGTELLKTKYREAIPHFDKKTTPLFEIIYPTNRIVVDYKGAEELVLLGIMDNETGSLLPYTVSPFRTPKIYDSNIPREMIKQLCPNDGSCEGLVITFSDDVRVKIKTEEYVRLHRLLTQVSSKSIWDLLREGSNIDEMIDNVPDEFFEWVRDTKKYLEARFNRLMQEATELAQEVKELPRKEAASMILNHEKPVSSAAFLLLDGKKPRATEAIWRAIKPDYERPFRKDIDL